ncbi:MAG: hypothetical protein CNLJKLNK_00050 [Holosporales bacterium]
MVKFLTLFLLCSFSGFAQSSSDNANNQNDSNEALNAVNDNLAYFTDPHQIAASKASDVTQSLVATTLAHDDKKLTLKETYFGNPQTAKIRITMYSSPTCTHCAEYHKNELPALMERVNAGKLFLVMRTFIGNLKYDLLASKITWAKGPQMQHELMKKLLMNQKEWLFPALQPEYPETLEKKVNAVAAQLGVTPNDFKTRLKITADDPCGLLKLFALTDMQFDLPLLEKCIDDQDLERELLQMSLNAKEHDGKYLTFTPAFYIQRDPKNVLDQGVLEENTPTLEIIDKLLQG